MTTAWCRLPLGAAPPTCTTAGVAPSGQTCSNRRALQAGSSKKAKTYFPAECPRRFFDSDRQNLHTSSMCRCKDLTCHFFEGGGWFFSQLRFFEKFGSPRANRFRRKKEKKEPPEVRPRDGHVGDVCKKSGFISKNGVDIWNVVRTMSNIRYFLQIAWFECRIQFFRYILLNVEHKQVRSSTFEKIYRHILEYLQSVREKCCAFFFLLPRLEKA